MLVGRNGIYLDLTSRFLNLISINSKSLVLQTTVTTTDPLPHLPAMKTTLSLLLAAAASLTTSTPITPQKRQFGLGSSSTSSDLEDGECKAVTFIFARGSTETGNMGMTVGPATCTALKSDLGEDAVTCQVRPYEMLGGKLN